jgi:hypothetical protein
MKYILVNRNEATNVFRIVEESNTSGGEIVSEAEMIDRVKNDEHEYYTINTGDDSLTEVVVINDKELRSVPNDTEIDNISRLPRI